MSLLLPSEWKEELDLLNRIRTIHGSTTLEGNTLSETQVGLLLEGKIGIHGFYGLSNYFYRNGDEFKRRLQESRRVQPFDVAPSVGFGLHGFEAELGFIVFDHLPESGEYTVEIDFGVIERDFEENC
ncbi:MAG: hypothetical protein OXE73_03150 [Gammaproteobacteria bacterium]|nr:hypothetical protein [Gammaproteobacteria bacterium]